MTSKQPSAEALAWAQRLVRINTVSRESNLPLIETIADHLRSLQVPLRLTYDDDRRKANLFATLGAGKPGGGVVLSGHTDTVPWDGQAWTVDPLSAVVRDGRLYGRGSADMKSYIGLVVAQTRAWLEADLPFALHYAFSYDEEVGGFGAQVLLQDLHDAGVAPRICLIGEPTEMIPAIAHKGVHRWRCCVRGKAAHSSLTPQAVNAVEAAARVVAHISGIAAGLRDNEPRQAGFDVPYSTAAVCVFQGGIADNVVPEDCRFNYEFRDLPGPDVPALQHQVTSYAASLEADRWPLERGLPLQASAAAGRWAGVPPARQRAHMRCSSACSSPVRCGVSSIGSAPAIVRQIGPHRTKPAPMAPRDQLPCDLRKLASSLHDWRRRILPAWSPSPKVFPGIPR